ncbi:MAG: pentapeptide repeat-containing protein [Desulfomonilaceae bacterium]
MPKCKYHEICGLDADAGQELCILHSQDPGKDRNFFNKALAAHRKKNKHNFQHFVFPGPANFRGETFHEEANFSEAHFTEGADFFDACFAKGANFEGTNFPEGADFKGASFGRLAYFAAAEFTKSANFSCAAFAEEASFCAATFTGGANFALAGFGNVANFSCAKFNDTTEGAKVFRDGSVTEGEKAVFCYAKFAKWANFDEAKFGGGANFSRARFKEGATFSGAWFATSAAFVGTAFLGRALFDSRTENGRTIPIFLETLVDFGEADIAPLDALIFRGADLQKCHFLGTDLRKAEFTAVKWPKKAGRFRVYDEGVKLKEGQTREWAHIEQLYRQLKQNYEDRRDYERAGDFHYGEEEMRRKNPETPRRHRLFLALYWLVSGYGERYLRPLICAVGIVVLSAFLYLFCGLRPKDGGSTLALTSLRDWLRGIQYSFRVITLLQPDDLILIGFAKVVKTFETLAGPIFLGLFTWTVKQRLKR